MDLVAERTRALNRLYGLLRGIRPKGTSASLRRPLASEILRDVRMLDGKVADLSERIEAEIEASGTTLAEIFGIDPILAATIIGTLANVARFPTPRPTTSPPTLARRLEHLLQTLDLSCALLDLRLALAGKVPELPDLSRRHEAGAHQSPCSTSWQIHSASFTSVFLPGTFLRWRALRSHNSKSSSSM